MSRAPWNNVLHPAAETAGLPLAAAPAAVRSRRMHTYQKSDEHAKNSMSVCHETLVLGVSIDIEKQPFHNEKAVFIKKLILL